MIRITPAKANGCGGISGPDLNFMARLLEGGFEGFDFLGEFGEVFEVLIHAGEADVGDLVNFLESGHDVLADGAGGDFGVEFALDGLGDLGDEELEALGFDGAFLGGLAEGVEDFGVVEVFAAAVLFDDEEALADGFLEGGEAVAAGETLAAAADGAVLAAGAGVEHFGVFVAALGAVHKKNSNNEIRMIN